MIPTRDQVKSWTTFLAGEAFKYVLTAVFAGLGAYAATVYADVQKTEKFRINLNARGVGYPSALFSDARRENPHLSITFAPPELQRVAVCEYYFDRQETFREIMERYLERYSSCFVPVWSTEDKLEIRPNRFGGQLLETVNNQNQKGFWCKCRPGQLPTGYSITPDSSG